MNDWRSISLGVLVYGALGLVPIILVLAIVKETVGRRRDNQSGPEAARGARDKIMADGKVEGPKGPYVPHEKREAPSQKANAPRFRGPYGPTA